MSTLSSKVMLAEPVGALVLFEIADPVGASEVDPVGALVLFEIADPVGASEVDPVGALVLFGV